MRELPAVLFTTRSSTADGLAFLTIIDKEMLKSFIRSKQRRMLIFD